MADRPIWRTVHTVIEGDIIDRDRGWSDLELAMEPMGRALPAEKQTRELHLKIGTKETVLDEEGIVALIAFLGEKP